MFSQSAIQLTPAISAINFDKNYFKIERSNYKKSNRAHDFRINIARKTLSRARTSAVQIVLSNNNNNPRGDACSTGRRIFFEERCARRNATGLQKGSWAHRWRISSLLRPPLPLPRPSKNPRPRLVTRQFEEFFTSQKNEHRHDFWK